MGPAVVEFVARAAALGYGRHGCVTACIGIKRFVGGQVEDQALVFHGATLRFDEIIELPGDDRLRLGLVKPQMHDRFRAHPRKDHRFQASVLEGGGACRTRLLDLTDLVGRDDVFDAVGAERVGIGYVDG